ASPPSRRRRGATARERWRGSRTEHVHRPPPGREGPSDSRGPARREGDDRLHSARTAHAALYDRGPTTARSGHERGAPGAGRGGAVLAWSGMRGVVTLAAAQSLPVDFPHRSQLVLIAFVVALVTLVVQGGTLPLLIR